MSCSWTAPAHSPLRWIRSPQGQDKAPDLTYPPSVAGGLLELASWHIHQSGAGLWDGTGASLARQGCCGRHMGQERAVREDFLRGSADAESSSHLQMACGTWGTLQTKVQRHTGRVVTRNHVRREGQEPPYKECHKNCSQIRSTSLTSGTHFMKLFTFPKLKLCVCTK